MSTGAPPHASKMTLYRHVRPLTPQPLPQPGARPRPGSLGLGADFPAPIPLFTVEPGEKVRDDPFRRAPEALQRHGPAPFPRDTGGDLVGEQVIRLFMRQFFATVAKQEAVAGERLCHLLPGTVDVNLTDHRP